MEKRKEIIKKYVEKKNVLDLGIVDHNLDEHYKENWLHKFVLKNSKKVLGVDILKEEINKLKSGGYDVVCKDVQNLGKLGKFDVVVAGEIIEHVDNQGFFLKSVHKNLKKEGILIITTPNCLRINNFLKSLVFKEVTDNKEHKLWHSKFTLEKLLEGKGFKKVELIYSVDPWLNSKKLKEIIFRIICAINKKFSPSLIGVFKKIK